MARHGFDRFCVLTFAFFPFPNRFLLKPFVVLFRPFDSSFLLFDGFLRSPLLRFNEVTTDFLHYLRENFFQRKVVVFNPSLGFARRVTIRVQ